MIADIVDIYAACTSKDSTTLALAIAIDPPAVVWEGLRVYSFAIAKVRAEDRAREQPAPSATTQGNTVVHHVKG